MCSLGAVWHYPAGRAGERRGDTLLWRALGVQRLAHSSSGRHAQGVGHLQAENHPGIGGSEVICAAAPSPFHPEAEVELECHVKGGLLSDAVETEAAAVAIDVAAEEDGVGRDHLPVGAVDLIVRMT
jgi:hypothetical protein